MIVRVFPRTRWWLLGDPAYIRVTDDAPHESRTVDSHRLRWNEVNEVDLGEVGVRRIEVFVDRGPAGDAPATIDPDRLRDDTTVSYTPRYLPFRPGRIAYEEPIVRR